MPHAMNATAHHDRSQHSGLLRVRRGRDGAMTAPGRGRARTARWAVAAAASALLVAVAAPVSAGAQQDAGVHQPAVDALDELGVFEGTGCADGSGLCPNQPLLRWEMAVWLVRVLDDGEPPQRSSSRFDDVDRETWWASHTERLAELAVTRGCALEPLRFCPDDSVTRGQMAAFLTRAFELAAGPPSGFVDVHPDHTFSADIDALAASRVTVGCGVEPPTFCPRNAVSRGAMATFLARAMGLIEAPSLNVLNLSAVSAGWGHSCALRKDGTIACWGGDAQGQADPPAGQYSQVAAGGLHTCALRTNGTTECWGDNTQRQLNAPSGTFGAVSAGLIHTCALRTDGDLECWGGDAQGQADPPAGQYSQVAAGGFHTCGLRTDGTIACWGHNAGGQADPPTGQFTAVTAGRLHTCGLRADGAIACWGHNADGQADPPTGQYSQVSAGGFHTCALTTDGAIACWGYNIYGQRHPPRGQFTNTSAGGFHNCALRTGGSAVCWGNNDAGQSSVPRR